MSESEGPLCLDSWADRDDIDPDELSKLQGDCRDVWESSTDPEQVFLAIRLFQQWVWPPMSKKNREHLVNDVLAGFRNLLVLFKDKIVNDEVGVLLEDLLERFSHVMSLLDPVIRDVSCPLLSTPLPSIFLLNFQTCHAISNAPSCTPPIVKCVKNLFDLSQAQLVLFTKSESETPLDLDDFLAGFHAMLNVAEVLILLNFKYFAMTAVWIRNFLSQQRRNSPFLNKVRLSSYVNFLSDQCLTYAKKLDSKLTGIAVAEDGGPSLTDYKKLSILLDHISIFGSVAEDDFKLDHGRICVLLGTLNRLVSYKVSVSQGILERKIIASVPKQINDILDLLLEQENEFSDFLLQEPDDKNKDVSSSLSICLLQSEILRKLAAKDCYEFGGHWLRSETQNLFRSTLLRVQSSTQQETKETNFMSRESCVVLPGVQVPGKHLSPVSPYEFIISRLQAFCVGATDQVFSDVIEASLFEVVMSPSTEMHWSKKMASDILCFLARYAGPEICRSHVRYLLDVFHEDPNHYGFDDPVLELLLERLGRLLARNGLDEIQSRYDPEMDSGHLRIVSIMDPSKFDAAFQDKLWSRSKNLFDDFNAGEIGMSDLRLLPSAVRILRKLWDDQTRAKIKPRESVQLWGKLESSGIAVGTDRWSVSLMNELFSLANLIAQETTAMALSEGDSKILVNAMSGVVKNSSYQDYIVWLLVEQFEETKAYIDLSLIHI